MTVCYHGCAGLGRVRGAGMAARLFLGLLLQVLARGADLSILAIHLDNLL